MDPPGKPRIPRALLRKRLLKQRADIDVDVRRRRDADIVARLDGVAALRDAQRVAVYWPIRAEPDLTAFVERWRAEGRRIALPAVGGPNGGLQFCNWDADTPLVAGAFGIPVSEDRTPVTPDCLIVPCLGFCLHDGRTWRLGYGTGFYDRTLAHRPTRAVGVAYDEAETGEFVPNTEDEPLSAIVTPSRVISSIASP